MNPIQHIRRFAAVLAGLAAALAAFAAASPTSLAVTVPSPGAPAGAPVPGAPLPPAPTPAQVQVHTIVAGGMPGWQITLIAVGAAVVAATVAVLLDRARTAHQKVITAAA